MKKNWYKKALSAVLAAGMALSFGACGGTAGSGDAQTDTNQTGADGSTSGGTDTGENSTSGTDSASGSAMHHFRADYLEKLPDSFARCMEGEVQLGGDKVFYNWRDDAYTEMKVCSYDILTGENIEYFTCDLQRGGFLEERFSLIDFAPAQDGSVVISLDSRQVDVSTIDRDLYKDATKEDAVNYIWNDYGYDSYEDAEAYFDSCFASMISEDYTYGDFLLSRELEEENYIERTYLLKIDTSGTETFRAELAPDAKNRECRAIGADAAGNVYAAMGVWSDESSSDYILVFDPDGNVLGQIETDSNYIYRFLNTADGKCGYIDWTDDGSTLTLIDADTLSLGEPVLISTSHENVIVALDDHTWLYSTDRGLVQYDSATEEFRTYLNWINCSITGSSVYSFGVLSDGRIAMFTATTSTGSAKMEYEVAVLNEISEEEAASVRQIDAVCFYMDSDIETAVMDFNKKHSDCHINITEYYSYSSGVDYSDALASYTTAIATDSGVDIVFFEDYSQMLDFAKKGLLADMNTFLADDADLGGNIMPNIVSACTYGDSLVALPRSYSIKTLVGRASDVGTVAGWTVLDLKNLYASKSSDTQLLMEGTKETALTTCISLGYRQFIDTENGTCSFDSQEFADVLEFVNLFPDEYESDEEILRSELLHDGKILLYELGIPDFGQMQLLEEVCGDDMTYIGYPTSGDNGALMSLYGITGITKNCEDTDIAWEFLRELYLAGAEGTLDWDNSSILRSDFDEFFANATNPDNYGTYGWDEYQIDVQVPSQEEIDEVRDIILNSTAVEGALPVEITNIINEEAAAFFAGQKTAEDVCAIIQSRVAIYLSETM